MSATIPKDLVEFLASGVSILVATRDAQRVPEAIRAYAPVITTDRRHVALVVPRGAGDRTIANLRDNGSIAIGFSRAIDHFSVQLKGSCTAMRPTSDADRPVVERYHAAYAESLYLVGMPRSLTGRFRMLPGIVVTVAVTDVYSQTPGPGAGSRLEAS